MNKEIKEQWVSALRSGKYKQGNGALRNIKDEFCCLGVLCDIVAPEKWELNNKTLLYGIDNKSKYLETAVLFSEIRELTGVELTCVGEYGEFEGSVSYNNIDHDNLVSLNDEGMSFEEIANVIEEKF
jgi:hypothetical protein